MSERKKSIIETIIISILIPITVWAFTFYYSRLIGLFRIAFWIFVPLSYTYVIFYRHKKIGKDSVLLKALLSSILQGIILYLLIKNSFIILDYDHHTGHIDGSAMLAILLLFCEPLLINALPLVIWIGKKIISYIKNMPLE